MAKIFVNYRRAESLKDARHLATLLDKGAFRGRIFIDLKGLDGAPDWLHELERQVAASDAMISIICPGWADVRDADGKRRIDNDKDFVRFELAEAFRRHIPVIPVLVDGARMPRGSELPDNLLYLTRPQAEFLRADTFDADCEKIAKRVHAEIAARRKRGVPGWAAAAAALVALSCGIAAGPTVTERLGLVATGGDEALRSRVTQLRAELADADAAARSAQTARLKAESEAAGLRADIGRLTTAADAARKQAAEALSLAEARTKDVASLKAEATALTKRAEAGEASAAESKRLSSQLTTAQKARDEAAAKADATAKKVSALETRVAQLSSEVDAAKKAAAAEQKKNGVPDEDYVPYMFRKRLVWKPGDTFRDCSDCPEMVVIPASTTGSKTSIPQPIAVGKFEVTFAEWDACVTAGGCRHKPDDRGWGRGNRPVINVSWDDATKQYLPWLSKKTGQTYRLLSEAEWEYAARAGTTADYFWGNEIGKGNANCNGCSSQWDNKQTAPVGSFKANAFGLHDMHGNVWELCEGESDASSSSRVVRGGSWINDPDNLRSASRGGGTAVGRNSDVGFRVARVVSPARTL